MMLQVLPAVNFISLHPSNPDVYSRGVQVPPTNSSSNHLKTENVSSIVERNGPSERLVIPLTVCCQPLDTT